jgi:hypothetical protein
MTLIPASSNDHIQNRSSGRSKSVSSSTLKMPSWPTTTDHGRVDASPRYPATWGWSSVPAGPAAASDVRTPASAGPSLACTSGSDSPPGAQASSGCRRHVARTSPQRDSISARCSPSHAPWPISRKPGSGRTGTLAPSATGSVMASAIARAVAAVRASGEWAISTGAMAGTGSDGDIAGRARRAATRRACSAPAGDSWVSAWPWKRPSTMNVDSPWRTRTSEASRPAGMRPEAPQLMGSAVSAPSPGGSSRYR